jgi:uncharacterized protein YjeT (DUF2065 family)
MATMTVTTLHLCIFLGLYLIAAGLGGLIDGPRWPELIADLERSPGLLYLAGAIAFGAGALIVWIHHHWTDPLAVIVTLIGYSALAEGLLLLALPRAWVALARPLLAHLRALAIVSIVLGALLLGAGLTGRADPIVSI